MSKERGQGVKAEKLKDAYKSATVEERKELYKNWAETYDEQTTTEFGWIGFREAAKAFQEKVKDKKARILDAGCGTGLSGVALAELGYTNLYGMDFSPEMLAVAEKTGAYRSLIEADLTAPVSCDEPFDAIFSTGLFGFGPPFPQHLVHVVDLVKPNGLAVITVNGKGWAETGWEEELPGIVEKHNLRLENRESIDYLENEDIKGVLLTFRG